MKRRLFIISAVCMMLIFVFSACEKNAEKAEPNTDSASVVAENDDAVKEGKKIMVEIKMADGGKMELELYPDVAPITVDNFVKLVNEGFYDGLTFHRIIKGFMIQGGDPLGNGTGGSDETIKGEFESNGVKNSIKHTRGVISMARSQFNDSASSQFFIMHDDAPYLDGNYAAFGKMVSGFEELDKLAETPVTDGNGTVEKENQPVIESIKIVE